MDFESEKRKNKHLTYHTAVNVNKKNIKTCVPRKTNQILAI